MPVYLPTGMWPADKRLALLGLPIIAMGWLFVAQYSALEATRLDYPIEDDWRYYGPDSSMPQEFSPAWLWYPAADTIYPGGKLIDWLVFRFLSHDFHTLAVVSFVVAYGGWLLSALLACFALARGQPVVLFAALLVFALPLAGAPYWVTTSPEQRLLPAIAYHQLAPVAGLAALAFLCTRPSARPLLQVALAILMTCGFSLFYASGAVAILVFAVTLLAFSLAVRVEPKADAVPSRRTAGAIAAAAGVCLSLHVWLPIWILDSNPVVDARGIQSVTMPDDPRFWTFFFALFDRAVLGVQAGAAYNARGRSRALRSRSRGRAGRDRDRERDEPAKRSAAVVVVAMSIAVLSYAALVSYGRASFGISYFKLKLAPLELSEQYARTRFFYWWITALLPFSVVGWGILLEHWTSLRIASLAALGLAVLLLLPKKPPTSNGSYLDHWNYGSLYTRDAESVRDLIRCALLATRGRCRLDADRAEWSRLPREIANPYYASGEGNRQDLPSRLDSYRRARLLGATWVDRWGLLQHVENRPARAAPRAVPTSPGSLR